MIYAKNPKKSNYTGFFYDIPTHHRFNYEEFLMKHALSGPNSNVHCLLESDKNIEERKDIWLRKQFG